MGVAMFLVAGQAPEPETALAGLGLARIAWSALPWREAAMLGLPVAGTMIGRFAARPRRRDGA